MFCSLRFRVSIHLALLPILPKAHLPKQNFSNSWTAKIKVNPTNIFELMEQPVESTKRLTWFFPLTFNELVTIENIRFEWSHSCKYSFAHIGLSSDVNTRYPSVFRANTKVSNSQFAKFDQDTRIVCYLPGDSQELTFKWVPYVELLSPSSLVGVLGDEGPGLLLVDSIIQFSCNLRTKYMYINFSHEVK